MQRPTHANPGSVHRARTAILAALAAGSLAACGGSTSPRATLAGQYALVTVNGAALPVVVQQDQAGNSIAVSSGTVVLTSRTYAEQLVAIVTQNGQQQTATGVDSGTYTVAGTSVTFTSRISGTQAVGTATAGTLDVTVQDQTLGTLALVYRKQ